MPRTKTKKPPKVRYKAVIELPPLPPENYAALKANIAVNGVLVPILVDSDGPVRKIIDGNYRKTISQELEYDCPEIVQRGLTEEEKRTLARALNIARRQLTTPEKRQIISDQLAETPERSNRWIGRMLGVDGKTVGSVRAELESGAEIPHLDETVGQDGKRYPSYWPRMPDPSKDSNQNYQTPPCAARPLVDLVPKKWTVWEPASGHGNLVSMLKERGNTVIATDIQTGQDFLKWKPRRHYDAIITNPPHRHATAFLRRCYEIGKPFALLLPLFALEQQERHALYREHGLQLLLFNRRIEYEPEDGSEKHGDIPFSSAWFCWNLLPSDLVFACVNEDLC
jgi:hypothetical protein